MPYSWAKSKQQPAIDDKQKGRSSLGDPAKSIISIHPPSLPHVAILRKRRRKRKPDERGWIREREREKQWMLLRQAWNIGTHKERKR
jgi:hypothetical protein